MLITLTKTSAAYSRERRCKSGADGIERNRRLYAEAWPGIRLLHPDGRLAVAAAADLYRAILADIEAHDYDVFTRRAHVGAWQKLGRLPGLWWRSRAA